MRCPEKCALSDGEISLSYAALRDGARAMAYRIVQITRARRAPIAVFIDRSPLSVLAFYAAVYSGNFYVPIDPHLPAARIRQMLETLAPALILAMPETITAAHRAADGRPVLEATLTTGATDEALLSEIFSQTIDTDPLYAIFTSGSTGTPKAVLICHRGVIDLTEAFQTAFAFSEDAIFGNQAPFDFDVSTKDLYLALKNAATVRILSRRLFSSPLALIAALNESRVNTLIWAVSAMRILANLNVFAQARPLHLTHVLFSGEVMPIKILNYWRDALPDVCYVNLYGPTEITCNCTYYTVDRDFALNEELPIGRPFCNSDVFLLDENDGVGEICVRGSSLALGYYNNPEMTARAFAPNPCSPAYPERIYRTGDLGRYAADGRLLFCGRRDYQVKHMGHRIELSEIERAANALPVLDAACCLYDANREKIVLFYQAAEPHDREIARGLLATLPKFMLPGRMIALPLLPQNKNGKIDRVLLRTQYIEKEA